MEFKAVNLVGNLIFKCEIRNHEAELIFDGTSYHIKCLKCKKVMEKRTTLESNQFNFKCMYRTHPKMTMTILKYQQIGGESPLDLASMQGSLTRFLVGCTEANNSLQRMAVDLTGATHYKCRKCSSPHSISIKVSKNKDAVSCLECGTAMKQFPTLLSPSVYIYECCNKACECFGKSVIIHERIKK